MPANTSNSEIPRWMRGSVESAVGPVARISTDLAVRDHLGAWGVRWRFHCMRYRVPPGIYAAGDPDTSSPVLVTANFKLTFDLLRRELAALDCWVLVLDTQGINVWCAAGKGTFGTQELVRQIENVRLAEIVGHRKVILPQLGAPGVAAHEVKKQSGFTVIYGPVYARDLPQFLENGLTATPEMRRVRFPLMQRLALAPVELLTAIKYGFLGTGAFFVLAGISSHGYSVQNALSGGLRAAAFLAAGIVAGTVLTPLLLPWLPGRSFSLKGAFAGILMIAVLGIIGQDWMFLQAGTLSAIGLSLIVLAVSSFIGMNFTGSSTYTSLSGVRKEMRRAVPVQLVTALLGIGLWFAGRFVQ